MIKGKTSTTGQNDGIKYIEIPEGWKRILENDSIHYISPSSCCLKSYENVIEYLKTDGTCKCGLDCPFFVHRVFNFDSSVQNKEKKDNLQEAGTNTSSCKLCESNRLKGNNKLVELTPSALNQTVKHASKKTTKTSTFDGTLTSKKVIGHSRPKLESPKVKRSKKVSSPLSDIPSPPPIPISSPVQNVPNNLGANQGPLPSFASIVSSSKFFNPGPNRGPLHPTGSLPFKTNEQNVFAFPKPISSAVTSTTVSAVTASSMSVTETNQNRLEGLSLQNTVPAEVKSMAGPGTSLAGSINSTVSSTATSMFTTFPTATNASVSLSMMTTSTVAAIISTPTLPSLFSPLDGATRVSNETVKMPLKAVTKSKPRVRPSQRAKPKPKAEQKFGAKSKITKSTQNISNTISSVQLSYPTASLAGTAHISNPSSSQWPAASSPLMSNHQTPNFNPSVSSILKNPSGTSTVTSCTTGNLPTTNQQTPHLVLPQQATVSSSIYMSQNNQTQGIRPQSFVTSATGGAILQTDQASGGLAQTSGVAVDGKVGTATLSQTIAAASMNYPVVATPRIQAQPGMMYVAATPGVNVFSSSYPYVAASTQQMQISQCTFSQTQNKNPLTVTTMVSTNQQPMNGSQSISSDVGASQNQGKLSFQVPGMYVQGTTPNQMFPLNPQSFNIGQYKGAYPLPSAMYQAQMQGSAMAFIAPNAAKGTFPGVQAVATGNLGQFAYQNPCMFGIVMPPSTSQPSSASVTTTRSSPATSTCATTSLQMIQPQTLQNPAVAAAFESFVPIAPAAGGPAPRFAQTLAHLASAYNTFPPQGILQSPNPSQIQLAYQMMQLGSNPNTAHMQQMTGFAAPDVSSLKHLVTQPAKQGLLTSTAAVVTTKGVTHVSAKPQTATHSAPSTITTMAQATREHPTGMRSPYSVTNTNSSLSVSSPPCSSVLSAHTTVSASVHNAPPAYQGNLEPATYNHKNLQSTVQNQISTSSSTSTPTAGSCNTPKISYQSVSSGMGPCAAGMNPHEPQTMSQYNTSHFSASKSAVTSTLIKSSERTSSKPSEKILGTQNTGQCDPSKVGKTPTGTSYSSFSMEQSQKLTGISPNGRDTLVKESSFEVKLQQHQPTNCDNNSISPLRTSNFAASSEQQMNLTIKKTGSLAGKPCTNSSVLSSIEAPPSIATTQRESVSIMSDSEMANRTLGSKDAMPVSQAKYESDPNYYATNPLLGMKRSCEAIEVYAEPPENTDCNVDDDDDDERDDYSSSNEDMERNPMCDDTPMDNVRDLQQHGDNQHVEDQFRISNQVTNDMYNGGCNEVHKELPGNKEMKSKGMTWPKMGKHAQEQEMKNEHLGVNIKANQAFVQPPFRTEMLGELSIPHVRPHFDIGDVVWAQARGLPSWPGQIVDESRVGKGRPDDGKKWVMWFGDHTFSQVEVDRLKTLSEGLRTLDDKARKKKYRAKKARISMEQAINEALEELEMRERLKTKQGMRSKTKKKRLR